MAHLGLLFIFICLSHLVQGTSTDSTSPSCPPLDGASSRSVWSIVWNCVLTLFICVWHTVHPGIPGEQEKYKLFYMKVPLVFITSFVAPEAVVSSASKEWCEVRRTVRDFRRTFSPAINVLMHLNGLKTKSLVEGYEWSMIHSHFVEMGGFVYHGDDGSLTRGTITALQFRQLCEQGKIANPLITERQIRDNSKSDARGKAIFVIQLFWFTLQVIVRGSMGLAITLIELDTVCMSALALLYLFFWWGT